jgi:hypothetical protein
MKLNSPTHEDILESYRERIEAALYSCYKNSEDSDFNLESAYKSYKEKSGLIYQEFLQTLMLNKFEPFIPSEYGENIEFPNSEPTRVHDLKIGVKFFYKKGMYKVSDNFDMDKYLEGKSEEELRKILPPNYNVRLENPCVN